MKTIEYRIVKRSKKFHLQYKHWYGWRFKSIVVGMDGVTDWDSFDLEEQVDIYVKTSTKYNARKYIFIKHPMLYMFTV